MGQWWPSKRGALGRLQQVRPGADRQQRARHPRGGHRGAGLDLCGRLQLRDRGAGGVRRPGHLQRHRHQLRHHPDPGLRVRRRRTEHHPRPARNLGRQCRQQSQQRPGALRQPVPDRGHRHQLCQWQQFSAHCAITASPARSHSTSQQRNPGQVDHRVPRAALDHRRWTSTDRRSTSCTPAST